MLNHEVNLTGDIFLSAAIVSYLGAFTGPFRRSLTESWALILRDKGVRVSDGYSLSQVGETAKTKDYFQAPMPFMYSQVEIFDIGPLRRLKAYIKSMSGAELRDCMDMGRLGLYFVNGHSIHAGLSMDLLGSRQARCFARVASHGFAKRQELD